MKSYRVTFTAFHKRMARMLVLPLLTFSVFLLLPAALFYGTGKQAAQVRLPLSTSSGPVVSQAAGFAVSAEIGRLPAARSTPDKGDALRGPAEPDAKNEENEIRLKNPGARNDGLSRNGDSIIQSNLIERPAIAAPMTSFDGLASLDNQAAFNTRFEPSDANIDVGPNHIVQAVNSLVRVYDKGGNPLTQPVKLSSIFAGLGAPCNARDDGDPIVLYDPLADRWLISQFCLAFNPSMHQLIAISKTADPTGQYYLYDFVMPNEKFHDYPHYGVWPDAYYMSSNQFDKSATVFLGAGAFAFDRKKMIAGDPAASYIYFDEAFIDPTAGGQLPADLDGLVAPPAGAANLFMEYRATEFGDPKDAIRVYEFHADFANAQNSSLTVRPDVELAPFDASFPHDLDDVEQPPPASSSQYLDAVPDRLMHRLAYRTLAGGSQSFVLNFTVNVGGLMPFTAASYQAGIRWVELRRNPANGAVTVNNQGTYAPGAGDAVNGRNTWMGSIAQDHQGDIGLGFSVSSLSQFPSILYAGRLAGDPAGLMAQGEATLIAGAGSQLDSASRWGDYSAMSVDPSDDCTFWYTNQYYNPSGAFLWRTRIGSFKVDPNCTASARGTIVGQITNCQTGLPMANVLITTPEGFIRQTDANGNYSILVAPGAYTVTASKPGFSSPAASAVVVNGSTATVNLCISPVPIIQSAGATIITEGCAPANGAIDPNETVTVSFCVKNTGAANATNLVGTLQATGGVTSPGGPQVYGAVEAGGPPVCRNFTFTASGNCGETLTATIQFQDGANNLGAVTYTFTLGAQRVALREGFDTVSVPNLPPGWAVTATSNACAGLSAVQVQPWKTINTSSDSPPNAAFANDPTCVNDNKLDTPVFGVVTASAQVSFRNKFNLESNDPFFYDGAVLEISINGGPFQDILTAGGSFVEGGYVGTISNLFGSPIGGRLAWSGDSRGFITTRANLPASAAGQNVQLRFRVATDSSFAPAGGGQTIDSILVTDGYQCASCCAIACPASVTAVTQLASDACAVVNYAVPAASGNCSVVCSPAPGSCFARGTTTVTCTATSPSGNSSSCSFTVSVFNICLEDDTNPSTVFLGDSSTGDYRFCCGGTTYTGRAKVTARGNIYTFEDYGTDRRVVAKDDESMVRGSATLQAPLGVLRCSITDRNTKNNGCTCQ